MNRARTYFRAISNVAHVVIEIKNKHPYLIGIERRATQNRPTTVLHRRLILSLGCFRGGSTNELILVGAERNIISKTARDGNSPHISAGPGERSQ